MKIKKILFFLFISEIAFSQAYVPFPDSNAFWRQFTGWYDFGCNCYPCVEYQIYIKGDTVINNVTYKNLYYSGTGGVGNCYQTVMSTGSPSFAFRENANKQIYFYQYYDSTEYLFYDFNLGVGDTLPCSLTGMFNCQLTIYISQIDSVQVGSSYRKRYWCSEQDWWWGPVSNYFSIIEGIGSDYGLFPHLEPNWQEKSEHLWCFKLNGQDVYPVGVQCNLVPVGMNEISRDNSVKIYPNPGNGMFYFFTGNVSNRNVSISAYDITGNMVFNRQYSNVAQLISFDLTGKPKGIYFLKIFQKDSVSVSKVLIQ